MGAGGATGDELEVNFLFTMLSVSKGIRAVNRNSERLFILIQIGVPFGVLFWSVSDRFIEFFTLKYSVFLTSMMIDVCMGCQGTDYIVRQTASTTVSSISAVNKD